MSWIKIISANFLIICGLLIILELTSRILVDFDANYYAAPKTVEENTERIHPYGKIPVNSIGFFDGEWHDPKRLPRIGYFGDSVAYGVGAGYPYRITEYLDIFSPEFEHVNLSGGLGVDLSQVHEYLDFYHSNNIDKLIYLMNLNDIAPLAHYEIKIDTRDAKVIESENSVQFIKRMMRPLDTLLRGNSVLYTYTRLQVKNFITTSMGFEASGFKAIELTPKENTILIERAARTTAKLSNAINNKLPFCILILPYEMQISDDAALKYAKLGVKFEESFIDFETQKLFAYYFSQHSNVEIDWLGAGLIEAEIGSFFVYNLGDKIDYNHPNRLGHELLAKEIADKGLCI
ncbi:hypothetical protein N9L40_01345 [Rhodobacteraceae bacterium]|nr:hypothetical protein [Paracoccaceae bacterium]